MRARQARKILRHYNGGPRYKINWYWYSKLAFYGCRNDHRITEALKVYQRHGRVRHPLAQMQGVCKWEAFIHAYRVLAQKGISPSLSS